MNSSLPMQRPKRAGEDFLHHNLNTSITSNGEPSSKKPRFDYRNPSTLANEAPDEDPILDLDEIGGRGAQIKRNAVELDGYESDSDDDNFDQRARVRAREVEREKDRQKKGGSGNGSGGKSKDEEENDMFADLEDKAEGGGSEDEDVAKEGKGRRKEVRFMEEGDIEGQVASSKSGGHVSADFSVRGGKGKATARDREQESSSEEEVDEEERGKAGSGEDDEELGAGAKKMHAPKLDAFNMKNEADEGKFDESGNFIRNAADPYAVHDSWLEGSSKAQMRKAKEAQEKRDEDRRRRDIADDAISAGDLLGALISRMEEEETLLEALARLNKNARRKPKYQKNKRKADVEMDVDEEEAETRRRQAVEAITAAADQLLTRGQPEIYEAERALLKRQYKRETGREWTDGGPAANDDVGGQDKQWLYRWSDSRDGGDVHGPYDGPTMKAWNEAGFFTEGVEFREADSDDWSRSVDFI